ncbi:RING finger protein 32 isoform X1 [Hypanus sabinus]|uniref:RING finger protein 32 isoform X1 n=1 Tax=Hypanus sabinus TaxID=79690 RepID=UPI0028C3AF81|nr:RING finger protein 32 isoform X1 [Hypanus sabinus]XP_059827849.1 RING finger protein 32 isoform X1 [Hypanus sabinus]XP_059827850.1 RING finger protein 32 isoform X1 [Hypanus sabinus]
MDLSATISKSLSTSLMPGPSSKTQKDKRISTKPDTTVLAAVALQDHIIRNLQLQNHSLSDTFKTKERNKMNCYRLVNRNTVKPVVDTGIKRNEKKEIKEDEEREYVLDPKPSGLTLAQKMGLVEAPNAPLTANEWHLVKKRSMQQGDSAQPCAICREEFGLQQQVLLSCSHVFHRICLQAFEKFSGRRSCPMCRKEQYQTRVIHDGARLYRMKCATRIQSHWRGYIVRKWYKQLRHTVPPKDKKLRKRFYEDKLHEINDRLVRSCNINIDDLFSEIDHSVATSRRVLQQFERQYVRTISEEEWVQIQIKAIQRETFDCPICITPLDHLSNILYQAEGPGRGEKSGSLVRQTVLLSCSHTFHYACLQAFEDFSEGENHICPLCRSTYEKKVLSNKL